MRFDVSHELQLFAESVRAALTGWEAPLEPVFGVWQDDRDDALAARLDSSSGGGSCGRTRLSLGLPSRGDRARPRRVRRSVSSTSRRSARRSASARACAISGRASRRSGVEGRGLALGRVGEGGARR